MNNNQKLSILAAFKLLFIGLAVWYWHRYTQRGFWAGLGLVMLGGIFASIAATLVIGQPVYSLLMSPEELEESEELENPITEEG